MEEVSQRIHQARSFSTFRDHVIDTEHTFLSETYEWCILAKEKVAA